MRWEKGDVLVLRCGRGVCTYEGLIDDASYRNCTRVMHDGCTIVALASSDEVTPRGPRSMLFVVPILNSNGSVGQMCMGEFASGIGTYGVPWRVVT